MLSLHQSPTGSHYGEPFKTPIPQTRVLVEDIMPREYRQNPNNLAEAIPTAGDLSQAVNIREILLPNYVLDEDDKRYAIARAQPMNPNEPQSGYYKSLYAKPNSGPSGIGLGGGEGSSDADLDTDTVETSGTTDTDASQGVFGPELESPPESSGNDL
jgi:hypothetical protein